jgi:hypothetical protein
LGLMRHEDGWHLLNLCGKWPFATTQHNPTFLVERVLSGYPILMEALLDPVLCKGIPKAETLQALDALAESMAQKRREQGFG